MTLVPSCNFILAIGHDEIAGLESRAYSDDSAVGLRDGDVMNFDAITVSDHIDISALWTALKRREWNEPEVVPGVYKKMSVTNWLGKRLLSSLLKTAFSL